MRFLIVFVFALLFSLSIIGCTPQTDDATAEPTPAPESTEAVSPEATAEVRARLNPDKIKFDASGLVLIATGVPSNNTPTDLEFVGGLRLTVPQGWTVTTQSMQFATLRIGDDVQESLIRNQPLPTGQAQIILSIGNMAQLFNITNPEVPLDLHDQLNKQLENIADPQDPYTYGEPVESENNGKPVIGIIGTNSKFDVYTVLLEIGAGYYAHLHITTAAGESGDFQETFDAVIASLAFPTS